ncbi:DivIVA domain-containing protein [Streptomyces sp. NPDC015131]|uniref:DivIVA domain-containing protein n=1 Tax=Streptomyces sp. NPDC015131 TaxID=3364941 RepID=UPI0037035AC1
MLTPADIETKQFTTTRIREGYDQDEVDEYLDRISDDMSDLNETVARLEKELRAARAPVPHDSGAPTMATVEKLLVVAQRTADQTVAEAHAEAGTVRAEARIDADRIITDATQNAERLIAKAESEADGIVSAAHTERERKIHDLERRESELSASVQALQERETYYRQWLRGALAAFEREMKADA